MWEWGRGCPQPGPLERSPRPCALAHVLSASAGRQEDKCINPAACHHRSHFTEENPHGAALKTHTGLTDCIFRETPLNDRGRSPVLGPSTPSGRTAPARHRRRDGSGRALGLLPGRALSQRCPDRRLPSNHISRREGRPGPFPAPKLMHRLTFLSRLLS